MTTPVLANLICGSPARNHDFDFARLRLAQALYEAGDIRTDSFNDYDDIEALLSTHWGGEALGGRVIEEGERPLMYLRPVGAGGVLYMALGHANRPFDTPRPDALQPDRRGPWEMPVYKELVRRGVAWAAKRVKDI